MLRNKVILIVSPQSWDGLWVSKHHYALKLAERGNRVFFLDPPVLGKSIGRPSVEISSSGIHENLCIVRNYLSFPYGIKFHLPFLFYLLIKPQIRKIVKEIGGKIDVVWSFDLSDVYPLRYFSSGLLHIYHPVDMPHTKFGIKGAEGADVIISTSPEILDRYKKYTAPSFFIDHGLADPFIKNYSDSKNDKLVRVGYSGNLLRPDIDRVCLLKIIAANPSVVFEFWGADSSENESGNGAPDSSTAGFIRKLKAFSNVILNGPVPFEKLPVAFSRMDGFLICYDLNAKNPVGPNYHKIMEYLSSGKVIISSYVSLYAGRPELLQMVNEKTNERLPDLFRSVISDLSFHNSADFLRKRKAFAFSNAYENQLEKIDKILSESILVHLMDKIKLNLGCGAIRPEGWVNADSSFNAHLQKIPLVGKSLAKAFKAVDYESNDVVYMNLNKRWKYPDGSVDVVYASHLFEHLTIRSAELFLKESFRCLKKGGAVRLAVPDLHKICIKYLKEYEDPAIEDPTVYILWAINLHKEAQYSNEGFLKRLVNEYRGYPHQHKFMYDDKSLALRLKRAGFSDIRTCVYGQSNYISEIRDVEGTKESYLSAYVEAVK